MLVELTLVSDGNKIIINTERMNYFFQNTYNKATEIYFDGDNYCFVKETPSEITNIMKNNPL